MFGQLVSWMNKRLPDYKKIFSKEFFENFKPSYFIGFIMALIYILLLYFIGWKESPIYKIELIKYLTLTPMLLSAFMIDLKLQIIPNRLNLTIFETGLLFVFIEAIFSIDLAIINLLGALVGAGIFLIITVIGGLIAGKEAMGFGDVKLMGAIGLYFGWMNIIAVSLIAFLLGAIIGIFVIIVNKIRKKEEDGYMPFGPFIVVASFIVMVVPFEILKLILFKIFTLGLA